MRLTILCSLLPPSGNATSTRRDRRTKSFALQAAELAVAVPQVVAHRVTRTVTGGTSPPARDGKEFHHRVGAEKFAAFNESWNAMASNGR
jgi:hypothetical protein